MTQMTPMQRQWADAKARAKDAILLFRMGDFYELFADDAVKAAPILELALTSRDKDKGDAAIAMAGFPHHAAPAYIARLVAQGLKVAICDQLEDPKSAKGLVKRDITRIVTPGMILDDAALSPRANNYLVGVARDGHYQLAAIDWSTGDFRVTSTDSLDVLQDEIARLAPAELLVGDGVDLPVHLRAERRSSSSDARMLILDYVRETQGGVHGHIGEPVSYNIDGQLIIDATSRQHLDLFELRKVIDKTQTAMGGRQLLRWLWSPSTDMSVIQRRHDVVSVFVSHPDIRREVRRLLAHVYDLERLTAKVSSGRVNPRELGMLRNSLAQLPALCDTLSHDKRVAMLFSQSDFPQQVFQYLDNALADELPLLVKDGGIFRTRYDSLLDELTTLSTGGRDQIAAIEQREREATGISSLKVKYTRVFGYYIEITRTHLDKVPDHYKRKQTVATGERYMTPELMHFEELVSNADLRRQNRDTELFDALREQVSAQAQVLLQVASKIAQLDALAAFAEVSDERRYVRPNMQAMEAKVMDIAEGRHPVIEVLRERQGETFVPNSVRLDGDNRQMLLITGPNMAGKSTIMRQVALIQILAQAGCFVPAKHAELSLCDRIFTRVGASDDLRLGRSTFMVEMSETAHILKHATSHSLVLLDEIGRGTSTFDGLSIAWAVAEYLHDHLGARTLFATHYHELVELSVRKKRIQNMQVAVAEVGDSIAFLYTLIDGAAEQSYGIHVARLAGLPDGVLRRAEEVLASLEDKSKNGAGRHPVEQLALFTSKADDAKMKALRAKLDSVMTDLKIAQDLLLSLS